MASANITARGSFVSDGLVKIIPVRSGTDFVRVYNYTAAGTPDGVAPAVIGYEYIWQKGFTDDTCMVKYHNLPGTSATVAASEYSDVLASGGITPIDSSYNVLGTAITGSAVSKADPAVVTVSSTASLKTGDVVRVTNISAGMQQIAGIDYRINVINTTTFGLTYLDTNLSVFTAANTVQVQKVPYDQIMYPRRRVITEIVSSGTSSVIKLSVDHQYQLGEVVQLYVAPEYGLFTALNQMRGTITALDRTANTITVDLDSSTLGTWTWPAATVNFVPAQVVPLGENPKYDYTNQLSNVSAAFENRAIIGVKLGLGGLGRVATAVTINGPANQTPGDLICWEAGRMDVGSIDPITPAML